MKFKCNERILKVNDAEKPKQQQGCTRILFGCGMVGAFLRLLFYI